MEIGRVHKCPRCNMCWMNKNKREYYKGESIFAPFSNVEPVKVCPDCEKEAQ